MLFRKKILIILLPLLMTCSNEKVKRESSSLDQLPGKGGEIQGQIYQYKWPLSFPPVKWYAFRKIRKNLKKFLKELPLEKDVKKRVLKHLNTKTLKNHIVPFLLAIKEFYVPKKEKLNFNFKNYIKRHYPKGDEVPGLNHSLFQYDDDKPKKEKGIFPKDKKFLKLAIASVIKLYDAIIIQDPNFTLGKPPVVTERLQNRVGKVAKKVLMEISGIIEPGTGPARVVQFFMKDPEQVNALASTAIDVIHKYSYETYHMFALSYHRQKKLEKWLLGELKKEKQGKLWDYIEEVSGQKRYAVQFVVDGLQGNLLRSIVTKDKDFLKKAFFEHQNHTQFLPPENEKPNIAKNRNDKFITYLSKNNFSYKNPNYLSFFKELYQKSAGGLVRQGVSTTPTLSGRNIPLIQSGAPVYGEGGTGLPNFNFVDRESEHGWYFLGNQAFLISRFLKKNGMKSIFDRLPHLYGLNCNSVYMEGQNLKVDGYLTVTLGEKKRDIGEILCYFELKKRSSNQLVINKYFQELNSLKTSLSKRVRIFGKNGVLSPSMRRAKKLIKMIVGISDKVMPSYALIYNPWPDHFGHYTGPFADEIISPTGELNRLDFWLEEITKLYKEAGINNQTLWGMAGDHGLMPAYYQTDPIKLIFDPLKEKGVNLTFERISVDPNHPKLVDFNNRQSLRGTDVVIGVTAGGNFVLDLFKDHHKNWKIQPAYSDLIDHKFIDGSHVNMVEHILKTVGGTLDYMVLREEQGSLSNSKNRIIGKRGETIGFGLITRKGKKILYQYNIDLLEVTNKNKYVNFRKEQLDHHQNLVKRCINEVDVDDENTWCNEDEWMLLESFSKRPGGVTQISHVYDGGKSGTINLFPRQGVSYNTYKIGRHGGENYLEKDAMVGIWGAPIEGIFKTPFAINSSVNGSVAPTIYEFLTGKNIRTGENGWGYPSLFEVLRRERKIIKGL